ncbi:methyltransferase domain-containing protein [Phlyctema vagabunda]|uniref:Methyltransferase domain-containing protein n=1 Tax=Phlyctema vagabunda TaxID=108571 RepID=A0ABR4PKU6_9HELO
MDSVRPQTGGEAQNHTTDQALTTTENENDLTTTESNSSSGHVPGLTVDDVIVHSDDSAYVPSSHSSTYSVESSVYDFVEENGRTYHKFKEGQYHLPNDDIERDRLDLQHHLVTLTFSGELHLAPIKTLEGGLNHVLDIGTGTGLWAIEFATQFPASSVVGTDLSPIQPEYVPKNCHFEVDDAEDTWVFPQKFDYIHGRALCTCFKSHASVINSAFSAIRPGGYLELQDAAFPWRCIDDSWQGTALQRWMGLLLDGAEALGKDWKRVPKYKEYMRNAGFLDIVEKKFAWPLGTWAKGKKFKTLGAWCKEDVMKGLQAISMAVMTKGLRMAPEEIDSLIADVKKDVESGKVHVYIPIYVVYGRTPK